MTARRATLGFTLIELMIALTIGALLVTLGMPSFASFLRDSEIRSTAESVANGLRVARIEAARRNLPVSFTFVGGGASWAVNQVNDASLIQAFSKQEGAINTRVDAQPPQAISVSFNELGRIMPAPVGGTPNLQQLDISSAVVAGARSLRIYVDEQHGMRICDPSPLLAAVVPKDARAC